VLAAPLMGGEGLPEMDAPNFSSAPLMGEGRPEWVLQTSHCCIKKPCCNQKPAMAGAANK